MRIGYYAHHHGSGHCRQADKLAALLPIEWQQQLTVFTSLPIDAYRFTTLTEAQIIRLNPEDELAEDVLAGRAGQYWQPAALHYSPVGNSDIQKRSWQILATIQQRQIELMIIDVSAEVAMLCRACSVPYLYVRLPGERDDTAHISAFTGAIGLLAPYPRALEAAMTPAWVTNKTLYLDFLSATNSDPLTYKAFLQRLVDLALATEQVEVKGLIDSTSVGDSKQQNQPLIVTVIKGYGGHQAIDAKLPALRQALPEALIISLGPISDEVRQYVDIATEVDDVTPFIAHSDWLLMACGLNAIAQVYRYDTPLVVLPDPRPHREQEVMAEALIAAGRALSWQQFITPLAAGRVRSTASLQAPLTVEVPLNKHSISKVVDNQTTAQAFMDSLVAYSGNKQWFQQWLLPQLQLTPDT